MSNQKMENSVFMQIRIEKDTRDKFRKLCKEKAINSSELLRMLIIKWIKNNEKEQTHKKALYKLKCSYRAFIISV